MHFMCNISAFKFRKNDFLSNFVSKWQSLPSCLLSIGLANDTCSYIIIIKLHNMNTFDFMWCELNFNMRHRPWIGYVSRHQWWWATVSVEAVLANCPLCSRSKQISACLWADGTASLWSSLSWLDKVGKDTRKCIFSFAVWAGGETWVTTQTLFNRDYCWNTELFNTLQHRRYRLQLV